MNVKTLPRVFVVKINGKELTLDDPNSEFTPKQVLEYYANIYPEVTNSKIQSGVIKDDKLVFAINTEKGEHG